MVPGGREPARLLHRVFNFHLHEEQTPEVEHRENQKEEQGRDQEKFDHGLAGRRIALGPPECRDGDTTAQLRSDAANFVHRGHATPSLLIYDGL
jgi:hypothetical protein